MLQICPECKKPLHIGQHAFADGIFETWYCKECGFREEKPIPVEKQKFVKSV